MPLQATALYSGDDFSNSGTYIYMNGIFIWTDFGADYGDTGGSLALNYHHLFFNENHSWGSYFGIGGCYDTDGNLRLPAFAYGLYLNHPTLVRNAYDRLGSRLSKN